MELGIVAFAMIHIGAALAIYHHVAIRRQIHARIRRALSTAAQTWEKLTAARQAGRI